MGVGGKKAAEVVPIKVSSHGQAVLNSRWVKNKQWGASSESFQVFEEFFAANKTLSDTKLTKISILTALIPKE